ncbi:GTP pyrophosphokinase [Pectobacterium odoriferum]|uniref:GTP pyrophosphokinase n=1 Tax=Pectobacterium odoriferum TaxID=78398 RepID=UPI0006990C0B|nr:hypothetical protein [Pectobacterium odoriferum]MCA6962265.1 hypothetical protein [Pectobacterium odoriferum]MCH5010364.1 (p)ppGpp synthetase [Pectobacterium odoriferum]
MKNLDDTYLELLPKYNGLMESVKFSLEKIIENKEISLFSLDGRVKKIDSINSKIKKKGYSGSLDDIEDLCGIRIICFYIGDMDKLTELINKEFNVISESDKQKEANEDEFGYASRHYIVTLNEKWLAMSLFDAYRNLKIEIQLRTMLMHTWAAISHKLLYKRESDAPKSIKRMLNRLSALIELADEQFNTIKEGKETYIEAFSINEGRYKDEILNSDGLVAIINKYLPDRFFDKEEIPKFLMEVDSYRITLLDFENRLKMCLPYLGEIELEMSDVIKWSMTGICRVVMDLTHDLYYEGRVNPSPWFSVVGRYRYKIKNNVIS